MDPISKAFVAAIGRFAVAQGVPVVEFAKGQRKDDVAHEYLAEFEAAGHVEGGTYSGTSMTMLRRSVV